MEQPFYIGQEVVAIKDSPSRAIKKGDHYTVVEIIKCKCGRICLDVGVSAGGNLKIRCSWCDNIIIHTPTERMTYHVSFFAPIERAKTKYVVKEVEVAPQIRELEVCQS